jgi:hypothetical protein
MTSIIALTVIMGTTAVLFIKMAITGQPRLRWGKSGTLFFTKREQAVACSLQSIVLAAAAVIVAAPVYPRRNGVLSQLNSALGIMTSHLSVLFNRSDRMGSVSLA